MNQTNILSSKINLKKLHETHETNMINKEDIKEDFINKHKSQVDFYLPNFNNSFLSGSYLKNINDFNIKESYSPNMNKTIKMDIKPHITNKSYFDSLTVIEKNYNE